MPISRLPALLALLGVALPVPHTRPASPSTRVLVVVSQDAPPYRAALTSFRHALERGSGSLDVRVVQLAGDPDRVSKVMPQTAQADLVLTLGTLATRESLRRFRSTPVVAGDDPLAR